MLKNIDLSIIIVSLNTKDVLDDCLNSLKPAIKKIDTEVIVIDSASTDGSVEMVKNNFPWVKLIEKRKVRGFGANNNFGLKIAKGRYVLLLNSDTKIIDKNIFSEMITYLDKNPKTGLASCALVNPDQKTYQGSGGYFPTLPRVFAWMSFLDDVPFIDNLIKPFHPLHPLSPLNNNENFFKKTHQQDWVTGAFYLLRKKALDEAGFFDEDFFLYVEEVELAYRIKKAGWQVWYLPKWKIVHLGQMSTGSESSILNEYKNLLLFYKKHFPAWQLPILRIILKLGAVLRIMVFGILKGKDVARLYVKAYKQI